MSVLARPQGTPERVWSYVAGLAALGGRSERERLDGLFNPGYLKDDQVVQARGSLAGDTFGAASSLALIGADRQTVWLDPGLKVENAPAFADHLHDRLGALPPGDTNAVLLEAYAWLAAESDRQGHLEWIYDWGREEFADRVNDGLVGQDEDGRLMNSTKVPAWRRWLGFLGLFAPLPLTAPDYPLHSARTARELARGGAVAGEILTAQDFLARVAHRQPYLDRGRLYLQACSRIGHAPHPRRLSPLMSVGLRDLHDQGAVELQIKGDAGDAVALTEDAAHTVGTFHRVLIGDLGSLA